MNVFIGKIVVHDATDFLQQPELCNIFELRSR